MSSIKVVFYDDKLNIYIDDTYIGNIIYSINSYHNGHYYLKLQLQQYDTGVAKELFDLISKKLDKPMQIMISSEEKDEISFIQWAGFTCKRKCYEVEASVQDYIGEKTKETLSFATEGDTLYDRCCEIMFDRYISTHKGINPCTGTKEEFFTLLPKTVFYEMDNETIRNLAFVEDNEIAYVYGEDKNKFVSFMQKLIIEMFEQNETIVFEADDCDESLVACCSICVTYSTFNYDKSGVFEDFYIAPEYRHKGIVRKLVAYAFEQSEVSSLTVGCADCDVEMYQAIGFQIPLGNMLAYGGIVC